jgi:hypothetical protein
MGRTKRQGIWKAASFAPYQNGGLMSTGWGTEICHYGPGVDLASDNNEYQEWGWGGGLLVFTACYRDSFTFYLVSRTS